MFALFLTSGLDNSSHLQTFHSFQVFSHQTALGTRLFSSISHPTLLQYGCSKTRGLCHLGHHGWIRTCHLRALAYCANDLWLQCRRSMVVDQSESQHSWLFNCLFARIFGNIWKLFSSHISKSYRISDSQVIQYVRKTEVVERGGQLCLAPALKLCVFGSEQTIDEAITQESLQKGEKRPTSTYDSSIRLSVYFVGLMVRVTLL